MASVKDLDNDLVMQKHILKNKYNNKQWTTDINIGMLGTKI